MKKISLMLIVVSLGFFGCARPLIIHWPEVVVQTNLPLSRQGVVVLNTIPDVFLDVKKQGYFGTSVVVKNLPPGKSFTVPADPLIQSQTLVVTVAAYTYTITGGDTVKAYLGARSKRFTFRNSGWGSRVTNWDVRRSDLRQR